MSSSQLIINDGEIRSYEIIKSILLSDQVSEPIKRAVSDADKYIDPSTITKS